MSVDEARRLCRELVGQQADLWTLPRAALQRAARTHRPLAEAVHDVVSGWLVTRAREGDDAARERLLELWHGEVLRWCRWNAARGVDSEDAAHDVLIRALQRLDRLTEPEGFRAWLWAIAWRVLREQERRPWRLRRSAHPPADETYPAPRADEALEHAERIREIRAVLEEMRLEDRLVLWHAYVDGRTRAQIGGLLGWPEGTVNRKLTRARERFRKGAQRRGLAPLWPPVAVQA